MSLLERFKLEDLENEVLTMKSNFPMKGDEEPIVGKPKSNDDDESIVEIKNS